MFEASTKAQEARRFIAEQEKGASKLERQSEALTKALKQLSSLKNKLLSDIPIKGVEISDGEILIDGIPFDRVNRARQIQTAIEVAKLRAGELGLIAIDDMEHLDAENFEIFKAAAEASGLQFVAARVAERKLGVVIG